MSQTVLRLDTPTRQALETGLARIRAGWCQHELFKTPLPMPVPTPQPVWKHATHYCATGGLLLNDNSGQTYHPGALDHLVQALKRRAPKDTPTSWNDAPERTQADVEDLYLETIRKLLQTTQGLQ